MAAATGYTRRRCEPTCCPQLRCQHAPCCASLLPQLPVLCPALLRLAVWIQVVPLHKQGAMHAVPLIDLLPPSAPPPLPLPGTTVCTTPFYSLPCSALRHTSHPLCLSLLQGFWWGWVAPWWTSLIFGGALFLNLSLRTLPMYSLAVQMGSDFKVRAAGQGDAGWQSMCTSWICFHIREPSPQHHMLPKGIKLRLLRMAQHVKAKHKAAQLEAAGKTPDRSRHGKKTGKDSSMDTAAAAGAAAGKLQ